MSTWRDKLLPASFRGVPFGVTSTERTGGRRVVKHEYPFRDEPFIEDMGRRAREFSFDAFVIGDDYMPDRDELLTALETQGPGPLVHPYYGTRNVVVIGDFRVRETADGGGMAQFSITFSETPDDPAQPTATVDAAGAVRASASDAADSVEAEFLGQFSVGSLVDSLTSMVSAVSSAVNDAINTVNIGVQDAASIRLAVDRLALDARQLIAEPSALFDQMSGVFAGFVDGTRLALLSVYNFAPGDRPTTTTPARALEAQNFTALQRMIQRLVVIQASTLALSETFDSYDSAVTARAQITDLLDEQAAIAADDTYPSLTQLRADLVKALPGEDSDLPRLASVTPPTTVPSLVLAHRLYGDTSLESDLIARNGIRDPRFVIGGREIEVLGRG